MEKEFIPYELALELKELGFDESCLGYYTSPNSLTLEQPDGRNGEWVYFAPTFSQAFRWFREKYFLFGQITIAEYELENNGFEYEIKSKDKSIDTWRGGYKIYEEAELECLKKLIEIVKEK